MKQHTTKRLICLALAGVMSFSNLAGFSVFAEEIMVETPVEIVTETPITPQETVEVVIPQTEEEPQIVPHNDETEAEDVDVLTESALVDIDEIQQVLFDDGIDGDIPYTVSSPTDSNARDLRHYIFKWADDGDKEDAEGEICHYSDALFNGLSAAAGLGDGKATTYNPVLANTTMCLTMSAFASVELGDGPTPDYTKQSQNAIALLKDLGFTNPTQNADYNIVPTTTTIGVVAAYKMIEEDASGAKVPLIAVAIRGSGYQAEWAGNVTVGEQGDHAGFDLAASQTLAYVKEYIAAQSALDPALAAADHVKVWITGFSRAAATSNMAAAKLDRAAAAGDSTLIGKKINSNDDVFAYTFETPKGHLMTQNDTTDYSNIFNIINANDLVPMVAPVSFGFERYGVDKFLPSKENDANYTKYKSLITTRLAKRYGKEWSYVLDTFYYVDSIKTLSKSSFTKTSEAYPTQGLFFTDFIANMAEDGIGDRTKFVNTGLQAGLQELMKTFMSNLLSSSQMSTLFKTFGLGDIPKAVELLWNISWNQKDAFRDNVKAVLIDHSKKAKLTAILTDDECGKLADALMGVFSMLRSQIIGDPSILPSIVASDLIGMIVGQEHVKAGHSVALCKAWLDQMDPKTTTKTIDFNTALNSGEYRRLEVPFAQSLKVKDTTPGSDSYGVVYDISDDGILTGEEVEERPIGMMTVNRGADVIVFLPTNHSYEITIGYKLTNNDSVHMTLEEYSPSIAKQNGSGQVMRVTSFAGHPRIFGSNFVLTVPAFSAEQTRNGVRTGSDVAYTMVNSKGENVKVEDHKLIDINNKYVDFNVVNAQTDLGEAGEYTPGLHIKGSVAMLFAKPIEGARFVSWTNDKGEIISTEPEFNYTIPDNSGNTASITANFTFCAAPSNVEVKNISEDLEHPKMLVTWQHNIESDATAALIGGYNIYRDGVKIANENKTTTNSYIDTTVEPGKTYTYTVRARSIEYNTDNLDGVRSYESDESMGVSHRAYLWLVPPTGLKAENKRDGSKLFIELTWNSLTQEEITRGEVLGYYIYRDGVLLNRTDLVTSYTDYGVENGKSYTYTICARSAVNDENGEPQVSPLSEAAQMLSDFDRAINVEKDPSNGTIPRTADNHPIVLWSVMAFVSMTLLSALVIKKRRKN